jgi:hypothetical protein
MRSRFFLALLLGSLARAAFAVTCGGFSIVPADHVIVQYTAPLPTGATLTPPVVSVLGTDINVSRNVSGGSAINVACVDDRVDLGYLGAGRFNLTWNDNLALTTARSTFTFSVGAPATGYTGDIIDVLPPVLPDRPVRLEVDSCVLNPAVAYLSGHDIHVSLYHGQPTTCKVSVLDLGILPEGTYDVVFFEPSVLFRFVVQQPPPSSACTGRSTITPLPGGTARLHFEDSYRGYTPTFGPPTVTEIAEYPSAWPGMVTVIQTVADSADSWTPGAPPSSSICHAEELDLGPVTNGYHEVSWWYRVNVGGYGSYTNAAPFSFYWQEGAAQCTSAPALMAPSAIEGARFDVEIDFLDMQWQARAATAHVEGHTITLDIATYFEGPSDSLPSCHTFRATLGPLPAGEYTVVWRFGGQPVLTTPLTVVKPARERAARH